MNDLRELNKLLSECCEMLVDCSAIVKDMPLEPVNKNIYRIGKALGEISELRSEIYRVCPDLKPEKWDEPPSEEDFAQMFEEAIRLADERLRAGKLNEAIETFQSYIFIGPPEKFERMARIRIKELHAHNERKTDT